MGAFFYLMVQYVKSLVVILLRERFRSMRNWKKSNLILIRKDGLFLRYVRGVCGACAGRVRGVCGACVGCVLGRVWRGGGAVVERKYRSPLYYPDTLVNLDTCLGKGTSTYIPDIYLF